MISYAQETNVDSLRSVWNDKGKPADQRLEALNLMDLDKDGMVLRGLSPDTIFQHAQLMYDFAKAKGISKWIGRSHLNKGNSYNFKRNYEKAIECYEKGLAVGEEHDDKLLIAHASSNMGKIYMMQSDFSRSVPTFYRAAKNYRAIGDSRNLAGVLSAIAMVYTYQNENENALKYLVESLTLREELLLEDNNFDDEFVISGMKSTIATLYTSIGETEMAKVYSSEHSDEFLDSLESSDDPRVLA